MDPSYMLVIEPKLKEFLLEDVHFEDVSTALIPETTKGKASFIAKEKGILCGLIEVEAVYGLVDCKVTALKKEGEAIAKGDVLATVSGPVRAILLAERTALNLLMHLSGIATITSQFQAIVDQERTSQNCKIAATRKTVPGLRAMEKRAVVVGGGDAHRWNLDDMVLLKDNHVAFFGNIETMVTRYKKAISFTKKIEVEVTSAGDAVKAARAGADIVMLDNMPVDEMKRAIAALEKENLRDKVVVESSGNVDISTVAQHAKAGVDLISTSAITLRAKPLDISLELDGNEG
nr:carboxylating nicotinate-nucleotide diphosphorylase [Candidatus Sigynarchaeum springense]MDO8117364.1 carboxylating nicotinate-nucleotide diphosphorylase [Candidatus Sigynarchaeota archaeon]